MESQDSEQGCTADIVSLVQQTLDKTVRNLEPEDQHTLTEMAKQGVESKSDRLKQIEPERHPAPEIPTHQ